LPVKPEHGRPSPQNAGTVVRSIETAVSAVRNGGASAVVTNPIHKASLYADGFRFPGHTEFLASLSGNASPLMMLAIEGLRVVPVTVHMSLASAAASLTRDAIIAAATQAHASLVADFGISNPRLAIAALNPHAGENGTMGSEEADIIGPAIAALRDRGIDVTGPHPADTMFHAAARKQYDVAICMYHDQALIPLKTLDFEGGVNITLGLPFIRTSPDHGTAFDIAGKGKASAVSLIRAMQLADRLARRRLEHA
jgi:4-hydroxythreonine-4-phosphate dehydrogenase